MIRNLFSSGVVLSHQKTGNPQSCLGSGFSDQTQDGWVTIQRLACPMFTDLTEEAMLNGIPLGGSGGIVADGDRHTEPIHQLLLKGMFPSSDPGSVTPTAVGQD